MSLRPIRPKIKIEYFESAYGRADPLVQLLAHKGEPYEYCALSQEEWAARKQNGDTGEFGALPIATWEGEVYQQTNATLRAFGVRFGYYDQSDWKNAGFIDMIVETQTDCFNQAAKIMFFTEYADKEYEIEKFTDGALKKLVSICD